MEKVNTTFENHVLTVSISPHVKSPVTVEKIMWTVVGCLIPPLILSTCIYGSRVLVITLISVISCVLTEAISQKLLNREVTIRDGSAVITGILLAYVIPPGVPYYLPVLGGIMAIFVTKQLFGGLGFNIFNPALIGRAFLMATFPVAMTSAWITPKYLKYSADTISSATPLFIVKHYGIEALIQKYGSLGYIYKNFFLGLRPGCIGETSALLILVAGLYLIYKGYIKWYIPVSMIGTIALLTWIFGGDHLFGGNAVVAILSGGVMLGAFFMATDYATSPNYKTGQLIYGAGIGALTVLIRLKGGYPEGVCYAILLMNGVTPALDSWFKPKRFAPPKGMTK